MVWYNVLFILYVTDQYCLILVSLNIKTHWRKPTRKGEKKPSWQWKVHDCACMPHTVPCVRWSILSLLSYTQCKYHYCQVGKLTNKPGLSVQTYAGSLKWRWNNGVVLCFFYLVPQLYDAKTAGGCCVLILTMWPFVTVSRQTLFEKSGLLKHKCWKVYSVLHRNSPSWSLPYFATFYVIDQYKIVDNFVVGGNSTWFSKLFTN